MAKQKPKEPPIVDPFATLYPNLAEWVQGGWMELGRDDANRSFVRILDIGGYCWEGKHTYPSVHEALMAADAAAAKWFEENG